MQISLLQSVVRLAKCLETKGALLPDQYATAIRRMLDHPAVEKDRLDYVFLGTLLEVLEDQGRDLN